MGAGEGVATAVGDETTVGVDGGVGTEVAVEVGPPAAAVEVGPLPVAVADGSLVAVRSAVLVQASTAVIADPTMSAVSHCLRIGHLHCWMPDA